MGKYHPKNWEILKYRCRLKPMIFKEKKLNPKQNKFLVDIHNINKRRHNNYLSFRCNSTNKWNNNKCNNNSNNNNFNSYNSNKIYRYSKVISNRHNRIPQIKDTRITINRILILIVRGINRKKVYRPIISNNSIKDIDFYIIIYLLL